VGDSPQVAVYIAQHGDTAWAPTRQHEGLTDLPLSSRAQDVACFPTSSHMFRNLIPALSDHYHVVAPDLPGFGFSDAPDRKEISYTFENITKVIDKFTQTIGLDSYAIYVFDYGAPVGLRLALAHPERVTALISQNGNAYEDGLSQVGLRSKSTGESQRKRTDRCFASSSSRKRRSGSTSTAFRMCRR
jgi:pimeloyl-ACP methyl ester carboxylesterase